MRILPNQPAWSFSQNAIIDQDKKEIFILFKLLNQLFPKTCCFCNSEINFWKWNCCPKPELFLKEISKGNETKSIDKIFSYGLYEDKWKVFLQRLKFQSKNDFHKAHPRLVQLFQETIKQENFLINLSKLIIGDVALSYVPCRRGDGTGPGTLTNLVLKEILSNFDISCETIFKFRESQSLQKLRKRKERLENIQSELVIREDKKKEKYPNKMLLIDDICASQASLDLAAQRLKERGVKIVFGLVLAHSKTRF